jgi:hypothetical protein
MKKWKIKYVHLEDRATRHPFFKRTEIVDATSRKEAIEQVQSRFSPPTYGEFRASPAKSDNDRYW